MGATRRADPEGQVEAAWQRLFEMLAELQREMESLCEDRPWDRAEGGRYLARLLASGLGRFTARPVLSIDYAVPRIGGFNPDYRFGHAALDPRGSYLIRGTLNDVHRLALGTYRGMLGSSPPVGHVTKDQLQIDARGGFELWLGDRPPEDPSSGAGRGWLRKSSETTSLMVRQLLLRPTDRPADLSIERVDGVGRGDPPEWTERRQRESLDAASLFVAGAARHFFRWTRAFSRLSNRIDHVPQELEGEVKADPDTFYAVGYFDLKEDEWLEVHFMPPPCEYWGLQTTNHWLEPLEDDVLVTHRNHVTVEPDADGSVTLAIAAREIARPNVLHTLGHRNGALFFRVVGAAGGEVRLPTCRVRKHAGSPGGERPTQAGTRPARTA